MQYFINIAVAFMVTVLCIALLQPLAVRLKLVDIPGGRKSHVGNIPLTGGIGMFIGFAASVFFLPISLAPYRGLFAGSALLVFIGVLDDFNEMSARLKFLLQIVSVLLMTNLSGVRLHFLGNLFFLGNLHLPYFLSLIVTVIAALGVMNAVNMIDGIDGLAGSVTLVELGLLTYLCVLHGFSAQVLLLTSVMSVLCGYLVFNFPVCKRAGAWAFMGDAGSLFLGFTLSWFLISLSQVPYLVASPIVFVWIIAVPLFDATTAIVRRVLERRSPFTPDAKHLHHLLKRCGFSNTTTVILISAFALLMGAAGIALDQHHVHAAWMLALYLAVFILYFSLVSLWLKKLHD